MIMVIVIVMFIIFVVFIGIFFCVFIVFFYSYVGCYIEGIGFCVFIGKSIYDFEMIFEFCVSYCFGYKYMVIQYSVECFCGNMFYLIVIEVVQGDCFMICVGNEFQYCGGFNRFELYVQEDIEVLVVFFQLEVVGNWIFYQCRIEGSLGCVLVVEIYVVDIMIFEFCVDFCVGYIYFGIEYVRECFCGNFFGVGLIEVFVVECFMICVGNGLQFCGVGNCLSIY